MNVLKPRGEVKVSISDERMIIQSEIVLCPIARFLGGNRDDYYLFCSLEDAARDNFETLSAWSCILCHGHFFPSTQYYYTVIDLKIGTSYW